MQRVRCSTLPPSDAMLRICALAASCSACAITGKLRLRRRDGRRRPPSAPWRRAASPSGRHSICAELAFCSALMSTTRAGRITSSFIRSSSVVPPARYWLGASAAGVAGARLMAQHGGLGVVGAGELERPHRQPSFICGFGLIDRVDDVRIGRAAAQVAAHVFADFGVALGVAFLDAGDRRHDLAGRAVAALEGVVIDEGLLHRMQRAVRLGEAFDGGDLLALDARGERQARQHAAAVDQHRAGAALAMVAALLGAGQADVLAQRVEQRGPHVERQLMALAVDAHRDLEGVRRPRPAAALPPCAPGGRED